MRIETERLILREWREEDRAPFAAMNADPEVMLHFPALLSRAESDALVEREKASFARDGFGLWAVERKDDGAFIGFIGLGGSHSGTPVDDDPEIGWRLARSAWRQGFASEGAAASLAWAWRNLPHDRIVSFTAVINEPSWRVMKRIGMTHRPDLDFEHPKVPEGSPLRPHVTYVIDRPETRDAPA
ncbi:MAG: GNAT family N-acetyltransferase [Pseudomonadota bacterium]